MRVAILGVKNIPAFGGAERVVEEIVTRYDKSVLVDIYIIKSDSPRKFRENISLIHIPALKGKHLRSFSYFLFSTIHYLFFLKTDIVHIHNSDFGLFALIVKLIARRTKIIGTFHGNPYEREKWRTMAKWYLRFSEKCFLVSCDCFTTVSKSKLKENEVLSRIKDKEIYFIPNGVTRLQIGQSIDEEQSCTELPIKKDSYILYATGRIESTKGLHHLVNVFNSIDTNLSLVIIGDFNHDLSYTRFIEEITRDNPKIYLHKTLLPQKKLFFAINNSLFFVFPSEIEAMSMMLLEVIGCKKLVICSNIQENLDIVGMNYELSFDIYIKNDLKEKIVRAIQMSSNKKQIIAENLYNSCISRFDWQVISFKYFNLYKEVLARD